MIYRVWGEPLSSEMIVDGLYEINALDKAARALGYADYSNLADVMGWDESEGLNIECLPDDGDIEW